jgi:hypothetical protein
LDVKREKDRVGTLGVQSILDNGNTLERSGELKKMLIEEVK